MSKGREVRDCKGWNFHVYALGADRCSICGHNRDDGLPVVVVKKRGRHSDTERGTD